MPTHLAERGLGERSSDPYAPVCLFRVRRLTQTLTSESLFQQTIMAIWKADTANGCLVARTLSTARTRTESLQRPKKNTLGPQGGSTAQGTAALLWDTASDELYASYPFSAPPHSKAALIHCQQHVTSESPRFPRAPEADRLLCRLTNTYHGCPHSCGLLPSALCLRASVRLNAYSPL